MLIAEQIVVANQIVADQIVADHGVLEFRFGEVVVQMVLRMVVAGETRIVQKMVVVRVVAGQSDRRGR